MILKNHFETFMMIIFQREPSSLDSEEKNKVLGIISRIGVLVIILGFGIIFFGLMPLIFGSGVSGRFN